MSISLYTELPGCALPVRVTVEYDPGDPGRLAGPPDRCYPPEPESVEVLSVQLNPVGLLDAVSFGLADASAYQTILPAVAEFFSPAESPIDLLEVLSQETLEALEVEALDHIHQQQTWAADEAATYN